MTRHGGFARMVRVLTWVAAILGMTWLPVRFAPAASPPLSSQNFAQINANGFGDCMNTYAWSSAWYQGKLYIGTNRGSDLQFIGDPDFHCQGSDDAAEIWRYTPETSTWERVFKSSPSAMPALGQPGKFLAFDNGFRDMIIFTEADATEALYVGGVIFPSPGDIRRPRILRTTDGVTFTPVPQDPGTFLGDIAATSFRAMAVYNGRLYVTAGSVQGEGPILDAADPAGGNDNFRQVSPPGLLAFELQVFNGFLYVGTAEFTPGVGFSVLKTAATGTPPYTFIPVMTNGPAFGMLSPNNAVLSMGIFVGKLYVGGQTDLIRINPNDTWELVVGNPRWTPQGLKFPISGKPSGFGNPFTGHLWRMQEHNGWFYVGTWDFAVFFRNWPYVQWLAAPQAGFDLWATPSGAPGVSWVRVTQNGFGDKFNHGVRSLVSTPVGLFLGTVNPWEGTQVWLGTP